MIIEEEKNILISFGYLATTPGIINRHLNGSPSNAEAQAL